ncbi:MAG: hypothetical protein ACNS63_09315 [Candidatus Nitrospinota bacterium M3_3B_026]
MLNLFQSSHGVMLSNAKHLAPDETTRFLAGACPEREPKGLRMTI